MMNLWKPTRMNKKAKKATRSDMINHLDVAAHQARSQAMFNR